MIRTIFIRVLNEGSDFWRPVAAESVSESTYRIKANSESKTELWEFQPGMVVKVERRGFSDREDGLFAMELAAY